MILALLIPLLFAQERTIKVELKHESMAYGTEIELGEIATLSGGTAAELASAKALELGYVPAPGYSRVLRTDRIQLLFERKLPGIKLSFSGEGATRVYPAVAKVSGAEIVAAARAQLLSQYDTTQYSFQARSSVADVSIPQGTQEHEIKARLETAPSRSGFVNIPVDILVDGARFRTVWTAWDVVVWETRRVLSRDIESGEEIDAGDFRKQRVPVGRNAPPALDPKLLPGAVAGHSMLEGSVIKPADVYRPKVVNKQDIVRLKIMRGGITASVIASTLGSGAIGDRIRVITLDKKIEFTATIQSRDTCVLILNG